MFDSAMSLKPHVSNVIRNSALHLRNISRLRKYLNRTASEQVVHAFVTSRLDMANSLLYGLPQEQLMQPSMGILTLPCPRLHIYSPFVMKFHGQDSPTIHLH